MELNVLGEWYHAWFTHFIPERHWILESDWSKGLNTVSIAANWFYGWSTMTIPRLNFYNKKKWYSLAKKWDNKRTNNWREPEGTNRNSTSPHHPCLFLTHNVSCSQKYLSRSRKGADGSHRTNHPSIQISEWSLHAQTVSFPLHWGDVWGRGAVPEGLSPSLARNHPDPSPISSNKGTRVELEITKLSLGEGRVL